MHEPHIVPIKVYAAVYLALVVLMALTVAAYEVHMGPLNNVIAMGIAVTKALLVILFFMGVKYSTRLTWVWAATGFIWLLLMFTTLSDYITRDWVAVPGWP